MDQAVNDKKELAPTALFRDVDPLIENVPLLALKLERLYQNAQVSKAIYVLISLNSKYLRLILFNLLIIHYPILLKQKKFT